MQYVVDALTTGAIYALFSLGLTLTWSVLNLLNLAHGAVFMAGAFMAYLVATSANLPFVVVLVVVVAFSGILAVSVDLVSYGVIRKKAATTAEMEFALLVASVGVGEVIETVVQNRTQSLSRQVPQRLFPIHVFNVGGVRVTNADIVVLASALVLTFGLIFFVNRTRQGRALRAVADQPEASALLGVNRQAVSRATMFVSGGLAGFAGLLLALQSGTIYYNMGDGLLLTSFAIIILGGIGSVAGALLGSFVLAGCETLATAIGVSQYEQVIVFAMVILVLLVRPSGLFGKTRQVRV